MKNISKGFNFMQPNQKAIQFNGGAGEFFIKYVLSLILYYVIIIGWPIAFNLMSSYVVDNLIVNGKKLKYSASYGEVLGFLLINILLLIITFGIYTFWFVPKTYRFIAEHTSFVGDAVLSSEVPTQPAAVAPGSDSVQN